MPAGHFGPYGGSFVAETLVHALDELKRSYAEVQRDPAFMAEFRSELKHFVGRPSPIYHAARMSRELGGAQIYLKREDLNHTGAHKVNNTIGQAMLARRMGKPRVIAETGAGQHGVATATICARYGLECVVYMGSEDVKRQSPNVYRMNLLGATVVPVESGSKTLKDALNEALRDWVTNVENTFYIIGTVAGPHPYPTMVRDFQRVIGDECLEQMPEMIGRQPDAVIACVGGGSNAMGIFYPYIDRAETRLIGVEAAGRGPRDRQARGVAVGRIARRAARQPHLPAAGRERPDHRDALDLGRPRLSRRRPGACVPEGHRPRRIRRHHRRRGAGGVPPPLPHRGHHPGARVEPCGRPRDEARADDAARPAPARQPVRPRRQGHRHRAPICPAPSSSAGRRARGQSVKGAAVAVEGRAHEPHRRHVRSVAARSGRKALIPYVTAGDPYADATAEIMQAMAQAGADVIELGVPFSDPMADGPVIQKAGERALARGIGMPQVLAMVRDFRKTTTRTPVVLMGYANPIERYGIERFVADAEAAGVDGVLVVDYPPEECEAFAAHAAGDAASIRSSCSRRPRPRRASRQVGRIASGYVYYVSLKGVTGAGHLDIAAVAASGAAHQGAREAAGRRRLRHPRRRDARAPWPTCPMRS